MQLEQGQAKLRCVALVLQSVSSRDHNRRARRCPEHAQVGACQQAAWQVIPPPDPGKGQQGALRWPLARLFAHRPLPLPTPPATPSTGRPPELCCATAAVVSFGIPPPSPRHVRVNRARVPTSFAPVRSLARLAPNSSTLTDRPLPPSPPPSQATHKKKWAQPGRATMFKFLSDAVSGVCVCVCVHMALPSVCCKLAGQSTKARS